MSCLLLHRCPPSTAPPSCRVSSRAEAARAGSAWAGRVCAAATGRASGGSPASPPRSGRAANDPSSAQSSKFNSHKIEQKQKQTTNTNNDITTTNNTNLPNSTATRGVALPPLSSDDSPWSPRSALSAAFCQADSLGVGRNAASSLWESVGSAGAPEQGSLHQSPREHPHPHTRPL